MWLYHSAPKVTNKFCPTSSLAFGITSFVLVFVNFLMFYMGNHVINEQREFSFPFQIFQTFFYLSCLIAQARFSTIMLNRSSDKDSLFVPDLRWKASNLSTLNTILVLGFLVNVLYQSEGSSLLFLDC